jgi:hypothetical protein
MSLKGIKVYLNPNGNELCLLSDAQAEIDKLEKQVEGLRDIIEKLWKDIPLDAKNFWELRLGPMKQYFNKKS